VAFDGSRNPADCFQIQTGQVFRRFYPIQSAWTANSSSRSPQKLLLQHTRIIHICTGQFFSQAGVDDPIIDFMT
jgi:hypothetical protein